jgi:monoamine oxidase
MGATWLGRKHVQLCSLLESLGLEVFPQRLGASAIYEPISTSPFQLVSLPEDEEPSLRIKGGTATLIEALAREIPPGEIQTGCRVTRLVERPDGLEVETREKTYTAARVVSTLPPYLLKNSVSFSPPLPGALSDLMGQTHTWMGESIKFSLVYNEPFWRESKSSGTVFSNVGPVTEMYDHANWEDSAYALKGFLNGGYYSLPKQERLRRILSQLGTYYGDVVETYLDYHEGLWAGEWATFAPYGRPVYPHQNNGNALYQKAAMNGRLLLAGTETAAAFPGYMEGAVQSARRAYAQLMNESGRI